MTDQLTVLLGTERVGTLEADPSGIMTFRYVSESVPALSLALPVREASYRDQDCRPFFAGLLPEGAALERAAAARRIQVYETFRLLQAYGAECAGAVRLLLLDADPQVPDRYERLDDAALTRELAELAGNPNFASDRRVRLSVAGVQSKAAVRVYDGTIAKPLEGSPSTHIIKVAIQGFPNLPQNEAFCMRLAAALGLHTARVELRQLGDVHYMLVERYDRRVETGRVLELHQEDMCQALGYPPARKYEIDLETGQKIGPGVADCVPILRRTRVPAIDIERFLTALAFNYLIGNADAHAKNFSLLHDPPGGAPSLAPLYDLVSTWIYPRLETNFAMRLGGVSDPVAMSRTAWDALAREAGVSPRLIRRVVQRLAGRMLQEARALMDELGHGPPYANILAVIGERLRSLKDAFDLKIIVDTPPAMQRAPGEPSMS
jgi:serine/threonine-protein kinase HipA